MKLRTINYQHFFAAIFLQVILLHSCHCYQVRDGPLLKTRPPWMNTCHRSDPNLDECALTLFKNIFPQLAVGIPMINVDRFEPLHLDRVSISKGTGAIVLAGSLYNLTVMGPSNSTPTYTHLNLDKLTWNFGVDIPLLAIKATYNLKGKILVLPLVGQGSCELRLGDVKTRVTTNIKIHKIENREVLHIQDMKVRFTVGSLKVQFNNLFNGNKVLGNTVNHFINNNGLEIVSELEESIGQSLADIFTELMNNVYVKMPLDLWLLTDEQFDKYKNDKTDQKTRGSSLTTILEKLTRSSQS